LIRYGVLLLSCASLLGLAGTSQAGSIDVAISGPQIRVNGKVLPFGKHPDSTYDEILGPHSHRRSDDGSLYWAHLGISLERRTSPADNCAVIFKVQLKPDPEASLGPGMGLERLAHFKGQIVVEGVPVGYTKNLSELKAATSRWATVSPFGYEYRPPGSPAVYVLAYLEYRRRTPDISSVEVIVKDFDEFCGKSSAP
jgi:hypothetical protein